MTDQANTAGTTASICRRFVALITEIEAIHGEVHEKPSVDRVIDWNDGMEAPAAAPVAPATASTGAN
jgi:hypothetical protein